MLNRTASLVMSTSLLKTFLGKLDIKRHSPSILYILCSVQIILKFVLLNIDTRFIKITDKISVICSVNTISVLY